MAALHHLNNWEMIFHFILPNTFPFRSLGKCKKVFEDRGHECDEHLEHSEVNFIGGMKYDICVWIVKGEAGVCDGR
jgi:hypothetical protein